MARRSLRTPGRTIALTASQRRIEPKTMQAFLAQDYPGLAASAIVQFSDPQFTRGNVMVARLRPGIAGSPLRAGTGVTIQISHGQVEIVGLPSGGGSGGASPTLQSDIANPADSSIPVASHGVERLTDLPELPHDDYPPGAVVNLITEGVNYRNLDDDWTSEVDNEDVADGSDLVQSNGGILSVPALPDLPDVGYPPGTVVYLTIADGSFLAEKLYRVTVDGLSWTAYVDGADITARSITANKLVVGTITASEIGANVITAAQLSIGPIGLTVTGLVFKPNDPATNRASWSAGTIGYINSSNVPTTASISAGSTSTWTSGSIYIYFAPSVSSTVLQTSTSASTAFAAGNIVLAWYSGGIALDATYGRSWIDGSVINVGTVDTAQLHANSITTAKFAVTAAAPQVDNTASGAVVPTFIFTVDATGVTLKDAGGTTVLTGAGFAGSWLNFLQSHGYNAGFDSPPPGGNGTAITGTVLPYWTRVLVSGTKTTMTWQNAGAYGTGNYVKMQFLTGATIGDEEYIYTDFPLPMIMGNSNSAGWLAELFWIDETNTTSANYQLYLKAQYLKADRVTTTGSLATTAVTMTTTVPSPNRLAVWPGGMPTDAAYLRVRVGMKRLGGTGTARNLDALGVQLVPVPFTQAIAGYNGTALGWVQTDPGNVAVAGYTQFGPLGTDGNIASPYMVFDQIINVGQAQFPLGLYSPSVNLTGGTITGITTLGATNVTVAGTMGYTGSPTSDTTTGAITALSITNVVYQWNGASAATIQGIQTGSVSGRHVIIENISTTQTLTIAHLNAGATSARQIICPDAGDTPLGPNSSAILSYDQVAGKWRMIEEATYSSTPSAVSTAGSAGTAGDPPARGSHTHAHEPAHINHDTTWAAAGDLIIGTANDTAAILSISVPAANVRNVLGVDNGETTWSVKTALDGTAPTTVDGTAAAAGTSLIFAHRDHRHLLGSHDDTFHTDATRNFQLPVTYARSEAGAVSATTLGTAPDIGLVASCAATGTTGWIWWIPVPPDWSTGNFSVRVLWVPGQTDASSHAVRWQYDAKLMSNGADITAAGTTTTFTGGSAARTANILVAADTLQDIGVAPTNAANQMIRFVVRRLGDDAADSYTGVANIIGIQVQYTAVQ